jgi:hypothetical protein
VTWLKGLPAANGPHAAPERPEFPNLSRECGCTPIVNYLRPDVEWPKLAERRRSAPAGDCFSLTTEFSKRSYDHRNGAGRIASSMSEKRYHFREVIGSDWLDVEV